MIDKIFIDTNILVYLFDKTERQKQTKAKKIISERLSSSKFFLSVQVINEFINITSKKISFPIPLNKQKEIIDLLNDIFIIASLSLETTLSAIEIKNKYKYSFWDSLIISSAIENKCNILFSEDMQHGSIVESTLTIVNPFEK